MRRHWWATVYIGEKVRREREKGRGRLSDLRYGYGHVTAEEQNNKIIAYSVYGYGNNDGYVGAM